MLGHFAASDKRGVVVEVHLDAVGRIVGDQFANNCQPILAHLGHGKRQPIGGVKFGFRVVELGTDLPFGMVSGKIGNAAIGHPLVGRVVHI